MTITAGVIGCGAISEFHFSGLAKYGARVKKVCDLSREAVKKRAVGFDAEHTDNYMDIINDSDIDVVFVLVFSPLHKNVCRAAIEAGKAVICEKTLTTNAADSAELVSLAKEYGVIFYTSYMKRFFPAVQKMREIIPLLGTLITTHARVYQYWGNLWKAVPDEGFFAVDKGESQVVHKFGGGILTCGGSHILDMLLYLLGRPDGLLGSVYYPDGADYDLRSSAIMETAKNGVIHFDAVGHPLSTIGFLHDGWDERIEINGVQGKLEVLFPEWNKFTVKSPRLIYYNAQTRETVQYDYDPVSPFELAVDFFLSNIEKGVQGDQSILTGYEVDELIESILISSKQKRYMEIAWKL